MAEDLSTALGTDSVPETHPTTVVQPAGAPAPSGGFWAAVKDKIGTAQSAVASPVQAFGRDAAAKLGASDAAASTAGAVLLPVVVLAVVVVVVLIVQRGFSKKPVTL